MDAKTYFEQLPQLGAEIEGLLTTHARYTALATRVTAAIRDVRVLGGARQDIGDLVVALTDVNDQLKQKGALLAARIAEAEALLDTLDSPIQRDIIRCRYISGMSWEEIAQREHMDRSYAWRLQAKAFKALQPELELLQPEA